MKSPALKEFLTNRANLGFLIVLGVLVALHATVFFATMFISPIGFDEGFILQAPLNLVQGNGYSTEDWQFGGDRLLFDAIVSTGPLVEMPVALSFLIFGTSIEAARIVMLPFYVILLASLFILGRRVAGRWGGIAALATVLALETRADWPTTVIYGPSDALGEFAAAALLALALVILPRHRRLSGLVIGLAALCKFISFMAVPAFMLALLIVPAVRGTVVGWGVRIRELFGFAALVAVPSLVWELVKFISLGPANYSEALMSYLRFVFRSGSGVDGSQGGFSLERLARLFSAWHLPTVVVIALGVVLFAMAIVGLIRYWLANRVDRMPPGSDAWLTILHELRRIPIELWAAAATLGVFTVWWTFIASSTFIRHTMPVLLVAVPIVVALAVRGARWMWHSHRPAIRATAAVFIVGLIGVQTVQVSMTVADSFRAEDWTRAQQVDAADFIRSLDVDEVQGFGWWASPEVRFLSHVPSTPVGTGDGPLVISPILEVLDPVAYDFAYALCEDILYEKDGFTVCTVDPSVEPFDYSKPLPVD